MIIKTIKEPQDIFIVGCWIAEELISNGFKVTDDYSGFDVFVGSTSNPRTHSVECDGFGTILTAEEMVKYKDEIEESYEDCDIIMLPNFVGDIVVGAITDDGERFEDLDLDDYLIHQVDEDCGVFVELPENTETKSFLISQVQQYLRDANINRIVNN
jgi:hypothetical protein